MTVGILATQEEIWKGCGHKKRMVAIDNGPVSLSKYMRFREGNPEELCWDCWNGQRR